MTSFDKCARCDGEHKKLVFTPFKKDGPIGHTHWAMCPETNEPLLLSVMAEVIGG